MKREIAQGAIVMSLIAFIYNFTGQERNFSLTTFDNQNFCNTVCSMYTTTQRYMTTKHKLKDSLVSKCLQNLGSSESNRVKQLKKITT